MSTQPPKTLSTSECRKLAALIVDPNAYMRGIVADALRRMSVGELVSAASTDEAHESCGHFKPSFVITDWEAGRMSGLDFTRSVRRGERNLRRDIPIILLADAVTNEQLMAARQAGVNEFLLKPVSVYGLRLRVEEVIMRPRKFIDSRNYVGPCRRRRAEPGYSGPWRRMTDEPEVRSPSQQNPNRVAKLRAMVAEMTNFVIRDKDDYANMVRGLYKLLSANQAGIESLGDETVQRIWTSALRYIEGVGITPRFDAEVILRHFEAIAAIMDMPEEAFSHRQAVAKDLERLVTKRIHAFELDLGDSKRTG